MRVVVVGSGAMGLSAARVIAERGYHVVAIDRFGVGNEWSSSRGATRIWRLAHTDRHMVRLARRAVAAWRDLEAASGESLLVTSGLLWRGRDAEAVYAALAAEGAECELTTPARQRELFPELVTDDRPVVWQPEAGSVLASRAMAAHLAGLERAGGQLVAGQRALTIENRTDGVRVVTDNGHLDAEVAVVACGPWAAPLLRDLGINLPLQPVLEQVVYVDGPPGWETRPAVIDDVDLHGSGGFYAMPTPGMGYKIGIERPVRPWSADDLDRTPSPEIDEAARQLVADLLPGFGPDLTHSEVCTWTTGPDDYFVLDRVGNVVIGTSDGGQAFKFSALIGQILADLAEGLTPDDDVARFSLARFR